MRRSLCTFGLLTLLGLTAYGASLGHGFVYDDRQFITENRTLQTWAGQARAGLKAEAAWRLLAADFARIGDEAGFRGPSRYFRPVTAASYLIDAWFWSTAGRPVHAPHTTTVDFNPFGFHLTNVLVHLLNGCLVYMLAQSLLRRRLVSLLAAALFVAHPVHTENVSWISGRTDVLAAAFFLGALWAYVRFRRSGSRRAYGAALGLAVAGGLAKESALVLVGVLALLEVLDHGLGWFPGRDRGPSWRRRAIAVAPFALAAALYLGLRALASRGAPGPDLWQDVPWLTAAASFLKACGWYAATVLWPFPGQVYPSLGFAGLTTGALYLLLHLTVAGLAVAAAIRFRAPVIAFSVIGFYAALAPLSSLLPGARLLRFREDVDFPVAERFLYLPSFFVVVLAAWLTVRAFRAAPGWGRIALGAGCAIVLTGATLATAVQSEMWRDEIHLYTAAVRTSPRSVRMRSNLGQSLLDAFRVEEARAELHTCLRVQREVYGRDGVRVSQDPFTFLHLGRAALLEMDLAAARSYGRLAVAQSGGLPLTADRFGFWTTLAVALTRDPTPARRARQMFETAMAQAPGLEAAEPRFQFLDGVARLVKRFDEERPRSDRTVGDLLEAYRLLAEIVLREKPTPLYVHALRVMQAARFVCPRPDPDDRPISAAAARRLDELFTRTATAGRAFVNGRLERQPDNPLLHFLAGELERLDYTRTHHRGSRDRAVRHLERALELDPGITAAALARAALLREAGRSGDALACVEAATHARIRRDPGPGALAALRAARDGWHQDGRTPPGRAMVRRVAAYAVARLAPTENGSDPLPLDAATRWTRIGSLHALAGRILKDRAQLEQALASYQRALDTGSPPPEAVTGAARMLHALGRTAEARALLEPWGPSASTALEDPDDE